MKILLLLLVALSAFAQQEVRISPKPPDTPYTTVLGGYSGSNPTYICVANTQQPTSAAISVASASNANPVVLTVTAGHGFFIAALNLPQVIISGGTGNWTAINGTFTATPINSTTFSIPINSTTFGALAGTVTYTTKAPLLTSRIWSVRPLSYDGSGNLIWTGWSASTSATNQVCTTPTVAQ